MFCTCALCSDISPIVAITNGLLKKYSPALIVSAETSTPSSLTAFTVSSTTSNETYPIAPFVAATFATTAPVLSNSFEYTHFSSTSTNSSNASLVPEPDSLPITTIG